MTSDAKIGLLLGLVFIFIIAFIINGLPKLRGQSDSNELTTNMVRNDPPGLGAWERRADEVLNPPPQIAEQSVERQQFSFEPAQTVSTDDSGVRYSVPIPGYSSLVADGLYGQGGRDAIELIGPVRVGGDESFVLPHAAEREGETVPKETILVTAAKAGWPKTHVVTSDDSLGLATIAKRFYGPVEGNRRVNITRIFEANRNLLKSPDEIKIGQKLVIPVLATVAPERTRSTGLLSGSLFEPVKSIGQKFTFGGIAKEEPGRFYVVKEGDNLWKISAEKLGSGSRYKEIRELNLDVLPSEDDIKVGTRLNIPAE